MTKMKIATKIVSVDEIQAIEQAANKDGMAYSAMMEKAGMGIAARLLELAPPAAQRKVLVLVGPGNNGGDGLVAAHYLTEAGVEVQVFLSRARTRDDANYTRISGRIPVYTMDQDPELSDLAKLVNETDSILDALLGTGFHLPMRAGIGRILAVASERVRKRLEKPFVVAVDCPSGLDCDTGEVAEETLRADLTITPAAAKYGHFRFPGAEYTGKLSVVGIGLPDNQKEMEAVTVEMITAEAAAAMLPARPRDSHKGTFGTVYVVAGSVNYPGAPLLTARGAYRSGAGLVRLAVPTPLQMAMASRLPEATWTLLPHEMGVLSEGACDVLMPELQSAQAVAFGPGIGQEPATQRFVESLFTGDPVPKKGMIGFVHNEQAGENKPQTLPPFVIDADGLKLLARIEDWEGRIPAGSVLTPHPGEMAALTGLSTKEIQKDRVETARQWAKAWGHVLVLKGAFTVIAAPDERITVIPIATSALATAGTGDVLAGVIAALLAQGGEPYPAAILGAYLHARAGELAAETSGCEESVLAGDVADHLGRAIAEIRSIQG